MDAPMSGGCSRRSRTEGWRRFAVACNSWPWPAVAWWGTMCRSHDSDRGQPPRGSIGPGVTSAVTRQHQPHPAPVKLGCLQTSAIDSTVSPFPGCVRSGMTARSAVETHHSRADSSSEITRAASRSSRASPTYHADTNSATLASTDWRDGGLRGSCHHRSDRNSGRLTGHGD